MSAETYITIVGNLTADPEVRTTGNGGRVANLTIASTPRQFNRNSGQWEDGDALFMRCSAWDSQYTPLASDIQASLSKGMRVIAQGRLVQRDWTDRQGNKRTSVEMRLDEIGPALSRNTAQVTKNQTPGFSQQGGVRPAQAAVTTGTYAPAPAAMQPAQPRDPWGGDSDEPVF